jgi:ABC-type multidrug transport system fused ATPase/permease subunit
MAFLLGTWRLVDRHIHVRMVLSACGAVVLALLDTIAVLLVFPLIQLLVSPDHNVSIDLPFGSSVGGNGTLHDAGVLAVLVVALFATKSSLSIAFLRWNLGFILSAEASTAGQVFARHLAAAPHTALDTASVQRTLFESTRRVFQEGLAFALPALADDLVIVLLCSVLLALAPVEALVAVVVFGVASLVYRHAIHGRTRRAATNLHGDQRHSFALAAEALRASREIALTRSQRHFVACFAALRLRVTQDQRVIAFNEQLPRSFLEICLVASTGAVAGVAFTRRSTDAAIALVGTFAAVGFRVLPSLNRALLAAARSRTALPSLDQISRDLDTPRPIACADDGDASPVESVLVRDLTVQLPGRVEPVLRHVTFEATRGQITCIQGASGAGKSTLVNAILGFVPTTEGEVLINGIAPVDGPESWGGRAAYVPQEVVIFDASLRENVGFGLDAHSIDDDRVLAALEAAHLAELLSELPEGLSTPLGEGGARLSGGQRQRLGIARALYLDADVLVLDEATAGLDHDTERQVLQTLGELKDNRLLLIVSHHRSVMDFCDQLLVLRNGQLVSAGPRAEVRLTMESAGITA